MKQEHVLPVDPEGSDNLTDAECRGLLRSNTFGRIGVTSGGLPAILPVRYSYDGESITFQTGNATNLRAAQNGDVLAFQVDAFDPDTSDGWTVLVLGRASVVTTDDEDGKPDRSVRLGCELVSGRVLSRVSTG